ncbi:MAG TPA: response regulator [Verrucomicrobiae bacterium]|nr:response regulator [Verrucomicrobiae bacterium]
MNPSDQSNTASLREPFAPEATPIPDLPSLGRNRKVLVVDDNVVVLKAFEAKFKASGFEVILARDTMSAVTEARKRKPDLIVLDINFPPDNSLISLQWNGLNVLQWLKRFEELSPIPVVVVSGDDAEKSEKKALAAGGSAYFQKPLNFTAFAEALRRLFRPIPA